MFSILTQYWGMRFCSYNNSQCSFQTCSHYWKAHFATNKSAWRQTEKDLFSAKQANKIDKDRVENTITLWILQMNLCLQGIISGKKEKEILSLFTASCWLILMLAPAPLRCPFQTGRHHLKKTNIFHRLSLKPWMSQHIKSHSIITQTIMLVKYNPTITWTWQEIASMTNIVLRSKLKCMT